MAKQENAARRPSRSQRNDKQETDVDATENGRDEDITRYERELSSYLEGRIKPGLNRGSIPMLARSIAKEIAYDDLPEPPEEDEGGDEEEEETPDLETGLRQLQAELGKDWILYLCIQGKDTWLTAEKEDASQRVEAPNPSVLTEAVKVLNEGGGRSGSKRGAD
jgi:hypothetical protein